MSQSESQPERKVIWGSFPLPDAEELTTAWNQLARRINNTAIMKGTAPKIGETGDRFDEYQDACPAITNFLNHVGDDLAKKTGSETAKQLYLYGAAQMIELLGTIAMNREFEGIVPDMPEPPVQP